MKIMLDILFLNVHRRYLNILPTHGGFLGIYLPAARKQLREMGEHVLELMNFFPEEVGALEKILDALPFIDKACYLEPKHFFRGLSIMTGRGCPFHCAFCHEGAHTRAVRFRSVENVLAEVDAFLKIWDGDELYIFLTDDTFTLNSERVKKICSGRL